MDSPYERILVPIDAKEPISNALDHTIAIAGRFDAVVDVLIVVEPGNPIQFGIDEVDDINRAMNALVGYVHEFYEREALDVEGDLRRGEPLEAILDYAREADADMMVLQRPGLDSTPAYLDAETVARLSESAPVPVLVIPADPDGED